MSYRKQLRCAVAALAASSVLLSAHADESSVYSINVVGFQKADVVENLQIHSNPFEAMTIRELVGNSGVYGTSQDIADNVIIYDPETQSYTTYYLRSHSSIGYPEWLHLTSWATNVYIEPGQAFFYRSRASGVRTNTVGGDVVMAGAVTNTIRPGLQLIAYPYSSTVLLSDLNLKNGVYGNSQDAADNVIIYDSDSQTYLTYYLRSHSSIGHPEWLRLTSWATNVYIESGQGFWFRSRSESAYDWVEESPYPDL